MLDSRGAILQTLPKLLRRNHIEGVKKLVARSRAEDLAVIFRHLTLNQQKTVFDLIDDLEVQAELTCELDPDIARPFLERLDDEQLLQLLREMSSDDAADVLDLLPEERAEKLVKILRQTGEEDVAELFVYDPETAAGLMSKEFFALHEDTTVQEAIEALHERAEDLEVSYYLYVINDASHLIGVVSLRQLVLTPPQTPLHQIMETDVVRVYPEMDQEDVAQMVARYNLLAVPVVDHHNVLIGVVTVDDIIDVIRLEATEDILKMAGVGEEYEHHSAFQSAKARIPWLMASFIGGLLSSNLISHFEPVLEKVIPLAAFIPIVSGMGGNVGIQSSTIVIRGLALNRIEANQLFGVVFKEILVGSMSGILYGLLLGVIAWMRYFGSFESAIQLGVTVGLAVNVAIVIAATVGTTIPLVLAKLNIDPALASGPFVATSIDVLSIFSYFNIAILLLDLG